MHYKYNDMKNTRSDPVSIMH